MNEVSADNSTPTKPVKRTRKFQDLTGQVFGRLTVLALERRPSGVLAWRCRCECGTIKNVIGSALTGVKTRSCGCWLRELAAKISTVHGYSKGGYTPEYRCWILMRRRCNNPNTPEFKHYGGRGIRVCKRWDDFECFLADMGVKPSPRHSIERIANEGNYEASNCKWATRIEQANNTRGNRVLAFEGQTQTLTQWSRRVGIDVGCIQKRLKLGWTIKDALTQPSSLRRSSPTAAAF